MNAHFLSKNYIVLALRALRHYVTSFCINLRIMILHLPSRMSGCAAERCLFSWEIISSKSSKRKKKNQFWTELTNEIKKWWIWIVWADGLNNGRRRFTILKLAITRSPLNTRVSLITHKGILSVIWRSAGGDSGW